MSFDNEICKAVAVLNNGGNIICPTDTVWGISADATNFEAVERVFELKNRPATKSMIVLVADLAMLKNYIEVFPEIALQFITEANSPTTIIYPLGKKLAKNVLAANGSVGVRIVNDDFCKGLIAKFGKPIISTSANQSGAPSPVNFEDISLSITTNADYCVEYKRDLKIDSQPSAIFLVEGTTLKKIR